MEAKFLHLYEERALVMLQALDLGPEGRTPVLFVMRHGEVICRIGASLLCDKGLTERKLEKLLKSRDGLGEGNADGGGGGCASEESGNDSDESE